MDDSVIPKWLLEVNATIESELLQDFILNYFPDHTTNGFIKAISKYKSLPNSNPAIRLITEYIILPLM